MIKNLGGAAGGAGGVAIAGGGATASSGTVVFSNSNGVSFGVNGQTLTASIAAAAGPPNISAGTTSNNLQSIVFSNSNNVSFGLNGSTITGSIGTTYAGTGFTSSTTAGTAIVATQNTAGLSLNYPAFVTNAITTQTNPAFSAQGGSSTFQTLLFTNSNNVSFSNTGGSVWGSYALNVSAGGGTSNALSAITFSNSNGVTFGLSTGAGVGTITASVAAAGGAQTGISGIIVSNTTYTSGTVSFSNANGVTFGSSAGQAITASVAAQTFLQSRRDFWPHGAFNSTGITQGSASFRYLQLEQPLTFSRVDVPGIFSLGTAATTATADLNISSGLVIYSRNGSTLSPITGSFGTTTYTWASNSANWSSLTGGKNISFALGSSLSPGEYWIGFQVSTTNNSSIGLSTTQLPNTISIPYGVMDTTDQYGDMGNTYATSQNLSSQGMYTATITATNQTIAMSNINATGTAWQAGNFPIIFRNY